MFSLDVHVALAPDSTYRTLISNDEHIGGWRMLRRPLVVALVIGTAVPIMAGWLEPDLQVGLQRTVASNEPATRARFVRLVGRRLGSD